MWVVIMMFAILGKRFDNVGVLGLGDDRVHVDGSRDCDDDVDDCADAHVVDDRDVDVGDLVVDGVGDYDDEVENAVDVSVRRRC